MMYVLTVDGARYECPTIEKLAEAIFDYGAESEEMTDAFWSMDVDKNLSLEAKDTMLKYVFHGSAIPVECLAHHVLRMYLRVVVRPAVDRLDRGEVDVVEWESEFGPVTVTKEEDD